VLVHFSQKSVAFFWSLCYVVMICLTNPLPILSCYCSRIR
jgi:hypothetical protein